MGGVASHGEAVTDVLENPPEVWMSNRAVLKFEVKKWLTLVNFYVFN
ncbi:hypothetical protein [Streptococcus thoraltensis]